MAKKNEKSEAEYITLGKITDNFRITIPKTVQKALGLDKKKYDFVAFFANQKEQTLVLKFLKIEI